MSGDVIQNAFATMEEEEAISEVTGDADFARKLIKEKNQLINPNARYWLKDMLNQGHFFHGHVETSISYDNNENSHTQYPNMHHSNGSV